MPSRSRKRKRKTHMHMLKEQSSTYARRWCVMKKQGLVGSSARCAAGCGGRVSTQETRVALNRGIETLRKHRGGEQL